ncbi:non-ribosomal peptide synthetase [Longispora albida]|uniref:non-ribosomal peptide synthetase n=1 Tax=Longispora albida TaxID=203523 RepID=UPI00037BD4DC|nr:non-ribosomal peptide synthetase [Longispora albida]
MTTAAQQPGPTREELIQRRLAGKGGVRRTRIPAADRATPLVLSSGQQQMWFLNRLETASAEYLVPVVLRITGQLDAARLDAAWNGVLARHEILRTRYELLDGAPVQVIDEPASRPLRTVDLSDASLERAAELVAEESASGFDLEREWPARATLLRTAEHEHTLVLVFHHIASDAWSTGVLLGELSALYSGGTLPPLPVQYADFAAWQRAQPEDKHLAYWKAQLAGLAPLELPADRPRPLVRDWHGAVVPFELPKDLAAGVRKLAAAEGVTLFAALLTAFQVLMARYTGQSDIPVGTVISGRGRSELDGMIGYGINSLVLRGLWDGDPAFTSLLAGTRSTVLDAFEHQDIPFARLVDELQPERDMSRTPLYQVAFNIHEDLSAAPALGDCAVEVLDSGSLVSKVDLSLHVVDGADGGLRGHFEYATSLFDAATVERMAGHFHRLLASAVAMPTARLSALELLDEAELAVLITQGEDNGPVARRVHEAFELQVERTPDATAIVYGTEALTYAELNARANQLAHKLRDLGAGPETVVGVHLERGLDLVPALLGVLKSGAAYLPLDPAQPADRLEFMLADAGAPILIADNENLSFSGTTITPAADGPAHNPAVAGSPGNLIYVIYTSGSTGKPKGVCLTHANVLRLLQIAERHYAFGTEDVWPLFHSYAFDVSVWELWGALLYGGKLVVPSRDVTRSPEDFLDLLVEHQVTVLNQTPSAFRGLVNLAGAGDPRIDRLALRAVVFAGEKLEFGELAPWVSRRGLAAPRLLNMYGITETTVHSTFYEVTDADITSHGNPVGYPLADLRIHLLDQAGRPVPIGVPGEIHVGGPGVARGYLNRPELTAERFVPDPFGAPGERLYKSGDLAKRNPDGSLEFCGRIDHQVKIRGYRIELGEIEAAMGTIPGIRDAVVIVREDTPGDKRLVGYSVPVDGAVLASSEIRAHLLRTLPEYMVPGVFIPLGKLPLTPNGKLDRRALPSPDRSALDTQREYTAPRTTEEEQLAAIWRETLGIDQVGVHDGFFDLGGDSIRAVGLAGALRAASYDVAVRDIFEHRTVAALAEFLTGRSAPAEQLPPVEPFALVAEPDRAKLPAGVTDAYPCSQVQLGMLVEMMADDGRNHYHNTTSFRIVDDQPFSLEALREAGRLVTARHEMLRTSFDLTTYSAPLQLVHAAAELSIEASDLIGLGGEDLRNALRAHMATERADVFDLATAPLVRFHAHATSDGSWWLTITECHAILEGWSHHSLIMELVSAYHRIRDGLAPEPFDAPSVRYADFIAAELRALESGEDIAYWKDIVSRYPKFSLPSAWADPQAEPGDPYEVWIPVHDLEPALRAAATRAKVPLKAVLHAAYLKVMSQLTDEQVFFSGLVCNARPEAPGADRVYGLYLNPLPFAYDRSARTWRDLVQQVFDREIELWPHRRFPLPIIQRDLGDGGRLLDARFSYQDFHQVDSSVVDYEATLDDSPNEFPLGVATPAGFMILTANRRFVQPEYVDAMAAMFRGVLEAMAADLDGDAREVFLGEAERSLLLGQWPGPVAPLIPDTVLTRFEAQAALTPAHVAITAGGSDLTYAALDQRANQIATYLRSRGVTAGSVVAVLLERSADLLASMLGTWKAGGAYVPIDPSYPADRVGSMLADAGAVLAITSAEYADRFTVDTVLAGSIDGPADTVSRTTDPDELAYVIFTSGSTGRPKGVQVTHRGLANHVIWAAEELASKGTGGAPLFSSVAFDLVVPNLWGPLVTGQRVFVVDHHLDMAELGATLAEAGPFSFIKLTPGHLEILGHQLGDEAAAALAPIIVVAGEGLPGALANRWLALLGPGGLVNEYGPTEASVGTCIFPVLTEQGAEIVPIGRSLPNLTMYVLDAQMRPAPIGVTGELYVGGTGVARGYANRPDLTADKFVPDPYGAPGSRLYRTGDLVRRLADGNVDFLGRVDDQVKIRGYRIELGEIQAVIAAHPAIREAAVIVRDQQILAYYTLAGSQTADDLLAHCAQTLPDYMLPGSLVHLDRIPLNANGKVDRRALPDPEAAAEDTASFVAPRTQLEAEIAAIWQAVLALPQVSVEDSFFDIGGHSIRAIALVGALRTAGHKVAVRDVFEHRTVAALALHLGGPVADVRELTAVAPFALLSEEDKALLPQGLADAYPVSQVQLGMLVLGLTDEQAAYHNFSAFRISDAQPLDAGALTEAVQIVVARHETLRTSFALSGYSVPVQLVHSSASAEVTVRDLRGLDTQAELRAFTAAERARRFEVDEFPQVRAAGLIDSDTSWWLALTMSHAIIEGYSHASLLMEIIGTYHQVRDGQPVTFEAPAVRYADFIAGELEALESAEDETYWRNITSQYEKFEFPPGWGEAAQFELRGTVVDLKDLMPQLRALATSTKTSLKSVLLAAHLKVLSQLTTADAFHAGLVCHGRPELEGADRVYGMHLNTLPFGYDRTARTWTALIQAVFDREVALWPHRRYPLPAVQRMAGGGRLLESLFNYLEFDQVDQGQVDVGAAIEEAPNEFGLNVSVLDGGLSVTAHSHVLSQDNVLRIAEMHRLVLAAMAGDAHGDAQATYLPSADLSILDTVPATREQQSTLHELFEAQVARTPEAIALTCGPASLTYAELNEQANQLAHLLRERGAGPDQLVGVCLDRGLDLVVSLLAVLKSGAAYLPLDPQYPADRRAYMLEDGGARLVITRDEGLTIETVAPDAGHGYPISNPEPLSTPDNLIYVIYTSGSTGKPKGVALSHANVHRLFTVTEEQFAFGAADVWTLFHSYAFDFSVWELWGPLLYGGRLVVVPFDVARSPEDFLTLLVTEQVTILNQTPSAFRSLVTAAGSGDERIGNLALRAVVFGGEKLELAELSPWVTRLGLDNPALINMYGITETTVHVTYHRITTLNGQVSPVGGPLGDLRVHLLDQHGHRVPVGVPGEIHVGGPGVARGYLNRPQLTAERFVPAADGERWYRSGDLARRNPDGSLEFLGRIDDQVKIRGYRIELGEISAALTAQPGIRDAVVIVRDESLVAYVIGEISDVTELRTALGETLPAYMIPAAFVPIESIPLTATGKLDKLALPDAGDLMAHREIVAPRTDTEARMAAVWAGVLGLEQVGVTDGFFDIGGDSLRAVSLAGAMRSAGLEAGVREIFVHQTIEKLAAALGGEPVEAFEPVAPFALISEADRALLPAGVSDAYPATQAQIGMAVEIANADRPLYHIVSSFKVTADGPFRADALRAAVQEVAGRHDTLRTGISLADYSVPMQVVHASAHVPVNVYIGASRHAEYVAAEQATPFDLATPPLLRVGVHVEESGDWWLTLTVSHLVTGGWDFNSLLMEIIDGYRGSVPAEAPAVRYADFVAAELASLASEADRDYWRGIVTGHARFALPAAWAGLDEPRENYEIRVAYHDLDAALRSIAAENSVSIKAVLHAAHLKVLSQLTEEEAFYSGLITDARPEVQGADRVHGMYINTLPFAYDRSAGTWRELIRAAFDREVELWPHRRYPLPAIQRETGTGRHPIEVVFDFTDYHQVDQGAVDAAGEVTAGEGGGTEFGLLVATMAGFVSLTSNTHVISRASADRLGAMYRAVLEAIAAGQDGDARLAIVPAPVSETAPFTVDSTVTALFEAQVARTPDAEAVTCGGLTLTYRELNERANRLAHRLRDLGARPETLVGVCLDRGPEMLPALLGVLKSGAGYLPVEPGLPEDRVSFMLADAGVSLMVSNDITRFSVTTITPAAEGSTANPEPVNSPGDLMYVMYTSGSTGLPKGVVATHRNVASFLAASHERFGFQPDDVWPLFHSYAFDVSVWEAFGALLHGGRVVIVPQTALRSPEEYLDLLVAEQVTVLNQTPSAFRGLVNLAVDGDERIDQLSLRTVILAGEKPELAELKPWAERFGLASPAIYNMYGITETTVESLTHRITEADLRPGANPVGYPFAGISVHVLDRELQPVPAGVPGQVYLGGHGIARGYLNRPDLTAERFVPAEGGERWYASGDLARFNADGSLEFLGRIDDQVKLRGFRVELGEITAVLSGHPALRDVVTIVRDETLISYYVPMSEVDTAELAALCAEKLPDYMVPAAFVALEKLPLAATGKLDRKALPAPDRSALGSQHEYVEPRTVTEERVAAVWRDVLGLAEVGVHDSFFDLGGDSIRAVSLVGALRAAGYATTVRDVFALRTVEKLAAAVTVTEAGQPAGVAPFALLSEVDSGRLPAGLADAYPASQVQLGMLLELMASEEHGAYHSVEAHRVTGSFDEALFRARAAEVLDRHEVLRTSFALAGFSVPMQLVHAAAESPAAAKQGGRRGPGVSVQPVISIADLRGQAREDQAKALQGYVASERATPFDLEAAPLLRLGVHVESDEAYWVTFTLCHAITEGWSILQLLRELTTGEVPAPAAVRYADFIAGELESLASAEDQAYWAGIAAGYSPFGLPAGWGETGNGPREPRHATVPFTDLMPGLRALATESQASLKAVLHAAHLKVMTQLTGEPRFHTGLVADARPEAAGADRVHGMFLNTVPFAHDRGARTWRDLVTQVFDREVELWPHRRYPLPVIQREAGRRLIDVYFNYQNFGEPAEGTQDEVTTFGEGTNEFALAVIAIGPVFELASNSHAISQANLDRLAGMYRAVLEAMATGPDGNAQSVCLPPGERDRLLDSTPEASAEPVTRRVHEAFEEQAQRTPDATALVFEGRSLTYAELNARANQLAHRLRELGAGPETVVGVHLERGLDLVPALLGVLKSGAAYLPLDPAQPADRLEFMLADAGAPILVTDLGTLSFAGVTVPPTVDGPVHNPAIAGSPDNLIYVIYTSGSTGKPKGVCLSHANVLRLLTTAHEHYAFDETDVWPLFHSYAFDVSVWELWGALLYGGKLIVPARETVRSPEDMLDLLVDEEVTVLNQTPSAFRGLVALAGAGDKRVRKLSLRAVVFAGEKLEMPELRPWVERLGLGRVALINMYGITETTVHSTYHRVTRADLEPGAGNRIGRPLADLRIYLLDAYGQPVPLGVPGEIYVAGAGVARGYLNRPELTAERFVPDPFGPAGGRLYKSGDLARRLPDGSLEFCGRIDHQVKIRGYRIELGEIEAALAELAAVTEVRVIVREDIPGDKRLVAYLVGTPGTPAQLRSMLARSLPEYMVPSAFVTLDRLPLTPNGKLDRAALPKPGDTAVADRRPYAAPRTPAEELVAGVWQEVLGAEQVGRDDRFFELGGHSVLVVQVVTRLRQVGLPIALRSLYQDPTVADLAAELTGTPAHRPKSDRIPSPEAVMAAHDVPGVAVALLKGGEVVAMEGYGVLTPGGAEVTPETVFQAGSISKHVTALAVLRLCQDGVLSLDRDANDYLRSWQVPGEGVLIRHLLGNISGLTAIPNADFGPEDQVPTIEDVFFGRHPATNKPIQLEHAPGTFFQPSNINYLVLQQLMEDTTGLPFGHLTQQAVFEPLGMTASSFDPFYPRTATNPVASGHDKDGTPVPDGWRIRPDTGSAGLWSTVSDLVRIAVDVRSAYHGGPSKLLTQELARQMLTMGLPGSFYGFGTVLDDGPGDLEFGHAGERPGYRAMTFTWLRGGDGLVALTNGENGKEVVQFLAAALGRTAR